MTEGPLGFDPAGVLVGRLTLPDDRYDDPNRGGSSPSDVLTRLRAHSRGVVRRRSPASFPYGGADSTTSFWPEGVPPRQTDALGSGLARRVTPNALPLMRVPLLSGRIDSG